MELEMDCFVEYFSCTKGLDQLKRFTILDMWIQKNIPKEHRVLHMNNGKNVQKRNPSSITSDHDKITVLLDSIDFERMSLDDFYTGPIVHFGFDFRVTRPKLAHLLGHLPVDKDVLCLAAEVLYMLRPNLQ